MKSSTILLLSSFIIVCNASLDYMDIAKKVFSELHKTQDPYNGACNINFGRFGYLSYVINETKWFEWNRLELVESSVEGRKNEEIHDLYFKMIVPAPIIKGKLFYPDSNKKWHESDITAISESDLSISIYARIHEFYSEIVWKQVSVWTPSFVSQFDCQLESVSKCDVLTKLIDQGSGSWNDHQPGPWSQLSKLQDQIERVVYSIKLF